MNYYQIGKRIAEARTAKSITQEKLAEIVNISINFLSCIECGRKKASFETYIRIVNALGISLDTITQDYVDNAEANLLKKELNDYFEALDNRDQILAVKLISELYRSRQ